MFVENHLVLMFGVPPSTTPLVSRNWNKEMEHQKELFLRYTRHLCEWDGFGDVTFVYFYDIATISCSIRGTSSQGKALSDGKFGKRQLSKETLLHLMMFSKCGRGVNIIPSKIYCFQIFKKRFLK